MRLNFTVIIFLSAWSLISHGAEITYEQAARELAAPIVDGFSDPNAIVYNEFHFRCAALYWLEAPPQCGAAQYEMQVAGKTVKFRGGLDENYLGHRFDSAQCLRYLDARIAGDKGFTEIKIPGTKLDWQPWERDIGSVLQLLAGAKVKEVIPRAAKLLEDKSASIGMRAAWALMAFKSDAAEAAPALATALELENEIVVSAAARALKEIGNDAAPALFKALESPNRRAQIFAAQTLHEINPDPKLAIPVYIKFLEREIEAGQCEQHAIMALGEYGEKAEAAIPVLSKCRTAGAWVECENSLRKIGPKGQAALDAALKRPSSGQ